MSSIFEAHIERHIDSYLKSDEFKDYVRRAIKWSFQGFAPGFKHADREAFTETVAKRVRQKARRRVYWRGVRLWRARMPWAWCRAEAERIVTEFLKDDKIEFGDPRYCWDDGIEIADSDMSYWEDCP